MRLNDVLIVSASVRTVSVFASPGTPSRSTCPPVSRLMRRRSTMYSWPTMRRPTCWTTSWTMDASAAVTVCALTSCSSRSVLALSAALRERGDDFHLARRQGTRLSRPQRPQLHRPEIRAHESLNLETQCRAQSSYFSRPALGDRDFEIPRPASDATRRDVLRHHEPILQLYTSHGGACRIGTIPAHRRQIGSLELAARMCQFVRRVAVG